MARPYALELSLRQAEIFKTLPSKDRQRIASLSRERTYAKGETLFHEGRPSDSIWLVLEGRVHLLHHLAVGRVQTTCVMTPGETFCCLPALDRGTYPATAVAATQAKVLQIPSSLFHEMMKRSPRMTEEAICLFCSRLRQVEERGCIAHDPVERRIAQALLTLRKKFGDAIPLTRQEIADLVGTTVETAIRTISRFQAEGWIRAGRGQIRLRNPDALNLLLR